MADKQLNTENLSGRQLSVAVMVAGLSPAATLAGAADWPWVVVWVGVGIVLGWFVLRRIKDQPIYQGMAGYILYILYVVWSVLLTARVLSRAAARLELTSGGSPKVWLLLIFAVPLIWIGWGKAAAFFRLAEVLWLAMAAVLALVLVFGVTRVEWSYVLNKQEDWLGSALTVGEILTPALFILPYIYNVRERSNGRGIAWLSALGGISAVLCLVTAGILGAAAKEVPHAFYVAAGTLGKSARCEGLLSVLWLLPDLTLAGVLCRVWGPRKWPAVGALLAVGVAMTGIADRIPREICVCGSLFLLLLVLLLPRGKGKIVVKF